jgi:hypothetical protein
MNLSALDEKMWNVIRNWDLESLKLASKMFEPLDSEEEDE